MYAFKTVLALAVPLMAVANPLVVRTDTPTSCNTGDVQCCNEVQNASNAGLPFLPGLLSLLGLDLNTPVGLGCTPITVVGGGIDCENTAVCCTNNNFSGLVNIGCSPINVKL